LEAASAARRIYGRFKLWLDRLTRFKALINVAAAMAAERGHVDALDALLSSP